MISRRLAALIWVFFLHLTGIYLFTRGFLLTRLSLPDISSCPDNVCTLPATHKRAVFLIIDSLRFDFITPNPPQPTSPYHHNILSLPRRLTEIRPSHSFIFNAYADPPTTTLQRIKGLTTGSLPTFVDLGNNFGGSSIAEDSILKQLKVAGKKVAFMGDDTWMSVFPDTFEVNMKFPFDSFNVEDLHTVDEGVIKHLFPLLEDPDKPFDFLIGHFLGVDHVGHRVGPDHPSMKAKLQQMDDVLERVVGLLDDNTLLVVLGDHGMDRSGDHGGDGVLETSSAMWIYSKGPAITLESASVPPGVLQYRTFPETQVQHRGIQQIDILPTLSLLLGLPIPYNNLGTVIPELFWRDSHGEILEKALELNAAQIHQYLCTYRSSPSGSELDEAWDKLQTAWNATKSSSLLSEAKLITLNNYTRVALSACRAMWAQFNPVLMAMGLLLIGTGLCASWALFTGLSEAKLNWNGWLGAQLPLCLCGAAAGAILGLVISIVFSNYLEGIDALDCVLFGAPLASCIVIIVLSPPITSLHALKSTPVIMILHAIAFLSNSFTFWEDRIVTFLAVSSIVPHVLTGFSAPTSRLRYRIIGFSVLYAACIRLISISTVCREEQQPYCSVTFYASSSLPSPPLIVLILALPAAFTLPWIVNRFLRISRSNLGIAKSYFPYILSPSLLGSATYWILEWADSASLLGDEWTGALRLGRTWIARLTFGWVAIVGGGLWWLVPLCLDVSVQVVPPSETKQIKVLGYAKAFGSPYLIFWTIFLAIVYLSTQLAGQLVLGLSTVALIAYMEVVDSVRDVKSIEAAFTNATPSAILNPTAATNHTPPLQFTDVIPVALLGLHAFYGTGHQSTISSMQWKSAFLLTPTVTYPFSPMTVIINSVGPIFLMALAAPLIALWNRAPLSISKEILESDIQVKGDSTLAGLGIMIYYATLLLGTIVSAAVLRRHLMVWKVFAPRFMAGVLGVLAVDAAVLVGVGIGVERVTVRVKDMFKGVSGNKR